MKKLIGLVVLLSFCVPVFAGELIIENVGVKKQNVGASYGAGVGAISSGAAVQNGDSQDVVAQKMGKPDIVSNKGNGGQVWVYNKTDKVASRQPVVELSGFGGSPASSFNAQIANGGFDRNIYSGGVSTVPMVENNDSFKSYSISVFFDASGRVENVVSSEK